MRFSIIMPVYNNADKVYFSLSSLLNQRFQDFEIIVVDDASNDGSLESIKEINKKTSEKITYLTNPENIGPGLSRNKGLEKATGEFIIFVDSDDKIEKNVLEELDGFISSINSIDLVICKYIDLSDKKTNSVLFENNILDKEDLKKFTIDSSYFVNTCWNMVYKNEYLSKNKIKFQNARVSEDVTFCAEAICKAETIHFFPKILYNYSGSSSSTHLVSNEVLLGYERMLAHISKLMENEDKHVNYLYLKNRYEYLHRSFILRAAMKYSDEPTVSTVVSAEIEQEINHLMQDVYALIQNKITTRVFVFCLTFESIVICKILSNKLQIVGILDNDERKQKSSYYGFNVLNPHHELIDFKKTDIIIICNPNENTRNCLSKQILDYPVQKEQIINYYPNIH